MAVDDVEAQAALDARLDGFLERLTPSLGRPDRRRQARTYVTGLLLEGERKSVQPLAGRLGATDNGQSLHHFIAHSPWVCEDLLATMAREAARLWPRPHAWILDETSFPKAGSHSVGVAPQYCGALGKIANCHGYTQRQHQGERAREWLFIEWPPDKEVPTDYWLAHLSGTTRTPTLKALVSLARERWRVEQDYRELKDELGLDHFEGRSWQGWHHHVALTCLAHLFLQSERRRPSTRATQKKPGRSARPGKPAADTPSSARRSRAEIMRPLSLVPHPLQHLLAK